MSLRLPLRSPIYSGSGVSTLVPYVWDCSIQGRTFMFDPKFWGTAQMARSSISLLKPQQDTGTISESSLNPSDGIRAAIQSWHHGAGQTFIDRDTAVLDYTRVRAADPYRFRSSKGVDPHTKWQLSLLHDTASILASVNTNLALQAAGARLYAADGTALRFCTTLGGSWSAVTGTPAPVINGIASDGFTVWTAHGASGVYETNTGTGAATSRTTGVVGGVLGYVKGRLMAADANSIFNITSLTGAAAARPGALYSHPNVNFTWIGFAEGLGNIYAAGYSGDKSLIYRTSIKSDGTALDVPVVAGELPDGEIVRSIGSYLGLILLGTDSGWWVADQDANGNLTVNKVQDLASAVYCFEGQEDFIWYGWSNFDSTSTGLGRGNLLYDTKGANVSTPAYASDLMATTQGAVLSVVTFADRRVFAVSGVGVFSEQSTYVASGTIDSGIITHGMPDDKVALSLTLSHQPLTGTITAYLAGDSGTFVNLGASTIAGATSSYFHAGEVIASMFEVRLVLTNGTAPPILTRETLESNPAPGRGEYINVALLMRETINVSGKDERFDVAAAYAALTDAETSGLLVTYQDVIGTDSVILEDHDFVPEGFTEDRKGLQGTYLLKMRRPRRRSTV